MERSSLNSRFSRTAAALFAGVIAISGGCVHPPHHRVFARLPQPASPDLVLQTWLSKNCKLGEDDDLERYMRQYGPQLTPRLIEAFNTGPPDAERRVVTDYATNQLYKMQKNIASLKLSPADADRIRNMNADAYSKRAVDEFVLSYKSTALAGLGAARTSEAIARLQTEAAAQQSTFQGIAKVILSQIKTPPKR